MKLIICKSGDAVARKVASMIAQTIRSKPDAVLGLATGSSVLRTYELLKSNEANYAADWSKVATFNLDEYVGIGKQDPNSYSYFMHEKLFNGVNIVPERIHIPDGLGDLHKQLADYELSIKKQGGIDLQLLGIGVNGHIGFNEPGSSFSSRTRVVDLAESTIEANSRNFADKSMVPRKAISLGLGTIVEAKKIILIATGFSKADAIAGLFEGSEGPELPCTVLRKHPDVTVFVDKDAASKLHKKFMTLITGKAVYNF